jgi:histidine triad (HIT) family protein
MPEEKPCIFCAIASGKVRAKRVYEDSDSIAFLDINPRSKGMTIVMPKKHFSFMQDDFMESLKSFQAAETVSQMIVQSLGAKFVEIGLMPSTEVPHFHFRLYPIYSDEKPIVEAAPTKMSEEELDEIAKSISSTKVEIFSPAKKEEEELKLERELSEEDSAYIRKQLDRA